MKTIFLLIIGMLLIPLVTLNVSAMCVAEELEWWETCNDTRPNNVLTLNPVLLFVVSPIVIIGSIIGGLIFAIRRKRK